MVQPVKHYLMYVEQNYSYAILRPLQEEIIKQGGKVAWFLAGNEIDHKHLLKDETKLETVDDIFKFNPVAIFYPANIAPTFLPGINVAIFHGFDAGKLDKKGNNDHFKIRNCFDLYCTQGPSTTAPFKELEKHHSHFKVIETGWCALDGLFREPIKNRNSTPTILFCSTFSKKLSCAPHLLETISQLSKKQKWNWIVQFHPKMPKEIVNAYKQIQNENLCFIETDNVISLLKRADLMICDTSSVLIMFLLLNKPVITYKNIDPKNYLVNIEDPRDLEESIIKTLTRPPELMSHIEEFIAKTHPLNDGKSSERVINAVDEVILGKSIFKKKPMDIIRQFKMRKKLKYWKFKFNYRLLK